MEKVFSNLRSIVDNTGKTKFCITCGKIATQEALFNVGDGVTLVEKYCDMCSKKGMTWYFFQFLYYWWYYEWRYFIIKPH